jgi:hypothetical protein
LPGPVPLDGLRVRRPILSPVSGVIGAPFAGALAANLAVLGVRNQLLLAAVGTAALLAGWL